MTTDPVEADKSRWARPHLEAFIWWCGDDWCDCREARIELVEPNLEVGLPWVRRRITWRGTFFSCPILKELEQIERELSAAAKEAGIDLVDGYGEKVLNL